MSINKQNHNDVLKLILFDIDQTLISNGGAGRQALYQALQEGLQINIEELESANLPLAGKTDPQIVREFMIACGIVKDELHNSEQENFYLAKISKVLELYLQFLPKAMDKAVATNKIFMHEGVEELLNTLAQDEKVALGLLTGNVERGARIKLSYCDLNRFFPVGAFGCDSPSRLDLPAIAHKRAQKHYNAIWTPADIVIIGDAENDVLCAKHYGAVSLAVNTGKTSWQELSKHEPDYLFSSLKNIDEILKAIMNKPKPGRVLARYT